MVKEQNLSGLDCQTFREGTFTFKIRIGRQGIHYQYVYVKIRNVKRSLSNGRSTYMSKWLVRLVRVSILGYYYVTLVSVNGKGHS